MSRLTCLAFISIIIVAGCGVQTPLQVGTNSLPTAALWQAYKVQLTTVGGTQPVEWSIVSGHLPPGVNLSETGVISGSPLSEGDFVFIAQVTDKLIPNLTARSS